MKVICLSGIDGSGKSTHSFLLYHYFKKQGINVKYLWLRWFAFFTYFLYFYARILRRTIPIKHRGHIIKIHVWWTDKALRILYPHLLLLDISLWFMFNVAIAFFRNVKVIILDRSMLDALVDIIWEARYTKFLGSWIGHLVYNIIRSMRVIILDANIQEILSRKHDIISLKELKFKRVCYTIIARYLNSPLIDTSRRSIGEVFKTIITLAEWH